MRPDETKCGHCGAVFTIMMPPSDGSDSETCGYCGVTYWRGHDRRRHVPPRERYKVPR